MVLEGDRSWLSAVVAEYVCLVHFALSQFVSLFEAVITFIFSWLTYSSGRDGGCVGLKEHRTIAFPQLASALTRLILFGIVRWAVLSFPLDWPTVT